MDDLGFNPLQPLTLTSDENTVYTLDDFPTETSQEITLLLKLCTVKHFSRLSLIKTLSQIWTSQCRFPVVVSEHSEGLFLVTFACEGDKRRILDGQPWHFAQSLTIFAAPNSSFPITPDQLHYVPFWVDSTTVKDGTGPYLRVRFMLDVNKPIRRGIHIRFLKMGREFTKWLNFKYERLSDFCFYCGKLDHTRKYCHAYLQKCDESLVPPPCPYDLLLRGKEKLFEKLLPFQYPHAPAITIADVDISHFPQGGQVVNPFLSYSMGLTSLLNSHMASASCLSAPCNSASVMIPTHVNPNQGLAGGFFNPVNVSAPSPADGINPSMSSGGQVNQEGSGSIPMRYAPGFSSVSTDSIIVSANHSDSSFAFSNAARSLVDALPTLVLSRPTPAAPIFQAEALRQDPSVKGKGLACASGVKRPCFQPSQAAVGGSLRSMLKRARGGEAEFAESLPSDAVEQAGDAEHTRPEK
uniref:Zinc knuckle CX2CX4HX4C domain-containing protein n=1 Tax=Cannabis sativa TaxID=3483 RepID=A0A803QGZ7_CANSA